MDWVLLAVGEEFLVDDVGAAVAAVVSLVGWKKVLEKGSVGAAAGVVRQSSSSSEVWG